MLSSDEAVIGARCVGSEEEDAMIPVERIRAEHAARVNAWNEQVRAFSASVVLYREAMRRAQLRRAVDRRLFGPAVAVRSVVVTPQPSPTLPIKPPAPGSRESIEADLPRDVEAGPELNVLTRRQRDIAELVARGFTNSQIADELVLTHGTVANHVAHILRRLDYHSRSQIAVWAAKQGLLSARPKSERRPRSLRTAGRRGHGRRGQATHRLA
jgi:DNA-binding NarL/FixJ family response regulator